MSADMIVVVCDASDIQGKQAAAVRVGMEAVENHLRTRPENATLTYAISRRDAEQNFARVPGSLPQVIAERPLDGKMLVAVFGDGGVSCYWRDIPKPKTD